MLDRRKQDVDVMERVLAAAREDDALPHTDVSLNIHPWLAGTTTSVVQVTILEADNRDEPSRPPHAEHR